MYVKKAAETTFVQKTRAFNVDEIDNLSINIDVFHKSNMIKITRKENSFEIDLSHSCAPARLTPLMFVHSHPSLLEGGGSETAKQCGCHIINIIITLEFF